MSKHTPGPWRACREGKCVCGLIWSIPEDMVVASLYYEKGEKCVAVDSEMWQANMSLIAAAPELLEFIQEFANSTRVHFEAMRADPNEFVPYLKAMSLIRKATGDE